MPNVSSGVKQKLSYSLAKNEFDMMLDANISSDAKLMRLDALYDERFTKMQRLVDGKMDKRDFAYFEGLFNHEIKKVNGFIDNEKSEKENFN